MTLHGDTRWERWLRNVAGLAFWGMFAVAAVGAAQSCLGGCGGNDALKLHASATVAMRGALDGAKVVIVEGNERAQTEVVESNADRDVARSRMLRAREAWAPAFEAQAIAVAAWQTWADGVLLAAEASDADGAMALAWRALREMVRAYARMREIVIDAGGPRLPDVPDAVAALVGAP